MSRTRHWRVVAWMSTAAVLFSGCAAAVRGPAQAPELALVTPTAFRLYPADGGADGCTVQSAIVRVSEVRGDTIFFRSAVPRKWPASAPRCSFDGAGYVSVTDHPELRAERLSRPPWWVSATAFPIMLLSGIGALLVVLIAAS